MPRWRDQQMKKIAQGFCRPNRNHDLASFLPDLHACVNLCCHLDLQHVHSHRGDHYPDAGFESAWNEFADGCAKAGRQYSFHTLPHCMLLNLTLDAFGWEWLRRLPDRDRHAFPRWDGTDM
eukprot:6636734-Karenia_brevis.AAC.2